MKAFLIGALVLIIILGSYVYFVQTAEAPIQEPQTNGTENQGRVMSIESYIRANITQLSPEQAVLGGTFYVTDIQADNGRGVVHYEDGHIALIADFTYTIDKYGITILSFEVRQ